MQSLNDLFGNMRGAMASKIAEKQDILSVIAKTVPEVVAVKCRCEMRNKVLYIQTHPALKNKIMLRQEEIIAALKQWKVDRIA